jgi:hypothetical protein
LFDIFSRLNIGKYIFKRLSKLKIINNLSKFKKNMKLLFKLKNLKDKDITSSYDSSYYFLINSSFRFFKRLSTFYCYYNRTFFRFKFKFSKNYKVLIKNFLNFGKSSKRLKNRMFLVNKKRKFMFKKYLSLNYFFLRKLFYNTNNVSEIYFSNRFQDIALLLNIYR